jgi:hypothetical protein
VAAGQGGAVAGQCGAGGATGGSGGSLSGGAGQGGAGSGGATGGSGGAIGGSGGAGGGGQAGQSSGGPPTTCQEAHGSVGCCSPDGKTLYYSTSTGDITTTDCGGPGSGQVCGWSDGSGYYDCVAGQVPAADPGNKFPLLCGGSPVPGDGCAASVIPVPCQTAADCAGDVYSNVVCDPVAKVCVGCLSNSDCGVLATGQIVPACDTKRKVCVGCVADSDCPGGKCNTDTQTCGDCLVDADCPLQPAICDTTNRCLQTCTKDTDCPQPAYCDLNSQFCQPSCNTSADCGGSPCDTSASPHRCVGCLKTSDCATNISGQICDLTPGSPQEKTCIACVTDQQCPQPGHCDASNGQCVASCTTNADCKHNDLGHACDTTTPPGYCVECVSDADCAGSYGGPKCTGSKANIDPNSCVQCLVAADCPQPGAVCTELGVCLTGCASNADCVAHDPKGRKACDLTATPASCIECLQDSDCDAAKGEVCDFNQCVEACASDADCKDPAHPRCDQLGSHRCQECLRTADCAGNPAGPRCDLLNFICEQCLSDTDCAATPATPHCSFSTILPGGVTGPQVCTACRFDADCQAPTPYCEVNDATGQGTCSK